MTVQQLRKAIEEIQTAIKSETPNSLIIIYDSKLRGNSEKIRPESILEINGKDVSHLSIEEKEKMLYVAEVHLYLPEKEPYPGVTCDYSSS